MFPDSFTIDHSETLISIDKEQEIVKSVLNFLFIWFGIDKNSISSILADSLLQKYLNMFIFLKSWYFFERTGFEHGFFDINTGK